MSAISPNQLDGPPLSAEDRPLWSPTGLAYELAVTFELDSASRLAPSLGLARLFELLKSGIARRWQRERRRRKVGRAYDMAVEIARVVPRGSQVLDVGCGNGFITHHLSALLQKGVTGIDVATTTEAPITYRQFDGEHFPVPDKSYDAVLFCYVLHHAQNLSSLLGEVRRTCRSQGVVIVYEDIPERAWDRLVCGIHDRKWRRRTGPCTFHGLCEWQKLFVREGFAVIKAQKLSRWRNLAHPVSRMMFVLRV